MRILSTPPIKSFLKDPAALAGPPLPPIFSPTGPGWLLLLPNIRMGFSSGNYSCQGHRTHLFPLKEQRGIFKFLNWNRCAGIPSHNVSACKSCGFLLHPGGFTFVLGRLTFVLARIQLQSDSTFSNTSRLEQGSGEQSVKRWTFDFSPLVWLFHHEPSSSPAHFSASRLLHLARSIASNRPSPILAIFLETKIHNNSSSNKFPNCAKDWSLLFFPSGHEKCRWQKCKISKKLRDIFCRNHPGFFRARLFFSY